MKIIKMLFIALVFTFSANTNASSFSSNLVPTNSLTIDTTHTTSKVFVASITNYKLWWGGFWEWFFDYICSRCGTQCGGSCSGGGGGTPSVPLGGLSILLIGAGVLGIKQLRKK